MKWKQLRREFEPRTLLFYSILFLTTHTHTHTHIYIYIYGKIPLTYCIFYTSLGITLLVNNVIYIPLFSVFFVNLFRTLICSPNFSGATRTPKYICLWRERERERERERGGNAIERERMKYREKKKEIERKVWLDGCVGFMAYQPL